MADREFQEDDILREVNFDEQGQFDWENMFDRSPPAVLTESSPPDNFPDSVSSWIGHLENVLLNDDDELVAGEATQQFPDDFLADILVDSPAAELVDASTDKDSSGSDNVNAVVLENTLVFNGAEVENDVENPDDPISKKRRRQLRNRDAAVRSRERKKIYVKDLEMKSRYLEGECRRLDRLLQCFIAENQALRLSMQKGNAFGVTSAKQESAVLLLESLLLGSLLWFLGIICLFNPPALPQSTLVVVPLENVEKKVPERGAESKMFASLVMQSFVNSRRCKASRTRMKPGSIFVGVLVPGITL